MPVRIKLKIFWFTSEKFNFKPYLGYNDYIFIDNFLTHISSMVLIFQTRKLNIILSQIYCICYKMVRSFQLLQLWGTKFLKLKTSIEWKKLFLFYLVPINERVGKLLYMCATYAALHTCALKWDWGGTTCICTTIFTQSTQEINTAFINFVFIFEIVMFLFDWLVIYSHPAADLWQVIRV